MTFLTFQITNHHIKIDQTQFCMPGSFHITTSQPKGNRQRDRGSRNGEDNNLTTECAGAHAARTHTKHMHPKHMHTHTLARTARRKLRNNNNNSCKIDGHLFKSFWLCGAYWFERVVRQCGRFRIISNYCYSQTVAV